MTDRWEIRVDRTVCQGTALCVGSAPERFMLNGGRSQPLAETIEADDTVLFAAECCPTEAITITDAATGQTVFPES